MLTKEKATQPTVTNKSRLRLSIFLHVALFALMLLRLSTSLLVMFSIRPPSFLQRLHFPKACVWEYVWLVSIQASIFAYIALKRNRAFLLKQFILGTVVFGLGPILYAAYDLSDDFTDYWKNRQMTVKFLGFPMVLLWGMFVAICLQVHGFSIYFATRLIIAWQSKGEPKKRS